MTLPQHSLDEGGTVLASSSSPPFDPEILELTGFVPPSPEEQAAAAASPADSHPPTAEPQVSQLQRMVTAWMSASGCPSSVIAQELGLTEYDVNISLELTSVREKIKRIKDDYWGASLTQQFDRVAPAALTYFEQVINDEVPGIKPGDKIHAAQWVLEKATGKPKQEVEVSGDFGIRRLFAELDALRQQADTAGTTVAQIIDVTPVATEEDSMDTWIRSNVPAPRQERQ